MYLQPSSTVRKKSLSLRSRRKHKAWGASPRIRSQKQARARETGDSVKFTGFRPLSRAPTSFYWYLNLGLAPQAFYAYACYRRLRNIIRFEFLCKAGRRVKFHVYSRAMRVLGIDP